jgi:hypothetical protein
METERRPVVSAGSGAVVACAVHSVGVLMGGNGGVYSAGSPVQVVVEVYMIDHLVIVAVFVTGVHPSAKLSVVVVGFGGTVKIKTLSVVAAVAFKPELVVVEVALDASEDKPGITLAAVVKSSSKCADVVVVGDTAPGGNGGGDAILIADDPLPGSNVVGAGPGAVPSAGPGATTVGRYTIVTILVLDDSAVATDRLSEAVELSTVGPASVTGGGSNAKGASGATLEANTVDVVWLLTGMRRPRRPNRFSREV